MGAVGEASSLIVRETMVCGRREHSSEEPKTGRGERNDWRNQRKVPKKELTKEISTVGDDCQIFGVGEKILRRAIGSGITFAGSGITEDFRCRPLEKTVEYAKEEDGGTNGMTKRRCGGQRKLKERLSGNYRKELVVDYNMSMASTPPDPQAVKKRERKGGKPGLQKE
eukprot:jgi/Psemu1/55930/gm1.55930_g